MFDKLKNAYELQKKAREIQKSLKSTLFTGEARGGDIKVTVNGIQEVTEIHFTEEIKNKFSAESLGNELMDALNKAFKKAQQHGSAKMREISGDLGLGGL